MDGRLVLFLLGFSVVPYAPTWPLFSDWRFTLHAYPFFLIAALLPLAKGLTMFGSPVGQWFRRLRLRPGMVGEWALGLCAIGAAVWLVQRTLPVLTALETFDVTVQALWNVGTDFVLVPFAVISYALGDEAGAHEAIAA